MSACQTEITNYLEDFLSDGDAYDAVEILTDIITEMKRYTPEEYYNMLVELYNKGVTLFHNYNGHYDIEQVKDNTERNLL